MAEDYGSEGRRRLDRLRQELGLDYIDPNAPGRETRTRSELLGYEEPTVGGVTAPPDQDMWSEEDKEGEKKEEKEDNRLPYPEYKRDIKQSRRSSRAVRRPDLYPEFYDSAGYEQSTRIWAMQWIPVMANEDLVLGDLLVVFARTTGINGGKIFVYPDIIKGKWIDITEFSSSYGRAIGSLSPYHVFSEHDKMRYQTLHAKTDDGMPWEDWIWDKEAVWAGGRPDNESGTYTYERAAARAESARLRNAARKAKSAAAKARREPAPPKPSRAREFRERRGE